MKKFYKNQIVGVISSETGFVSHGKILRIKKNKSEYMHYEYDVKLLIKDKRINVRMWDLGNSLHSILETEYDISIYPCFKKALLNCLDSFESFRTECQRSDDGPIPQMDDREYARGMMNFATYHYQIKKLRNKNG